MYSLLHTVGIWMVFSGNMAKKCLQVVYNCIASYISNKCIQCVFVTGMSVVYLKLIVK